MKKKLAIVALLTVLLIHPAAVLAVEFGSPPAQQALNISVILNRILFILWPVFVGFSIITFIVAGFLFLKAQGDPAEIKTAQKAVLWGVVGLIVGILSFSIPLIIRALLGF